MMISMVFFLFSTVDQMGLTNKCPQTPVQGVPLYPTSSNILPPTPTLLNQQTNSNLECAMTEQQPSDDSKVTL